MARFKRYRHTKRRIAGALRINRKAIRSGAREGFVMAEIVTVKPSADAAPAPPGGPAQMASGPQILAAYKQMLVALFVSTLLISAAAMALTLGFHYGQTPRRDPPLMVILIFAGALGPFFS